MNLGACIPSLHTYVIVRLIKIRPKDIYADYMKYLKPHFGHPKRRKSFEIDRLSRAGENSTNGSTRKYQS